MGKPFLVIGALLIAFGSLVAVAGFGGGDGPAWDGRCGGVGGPIEVVLATIRELESSGRYDLPPGPGGASGAYQYIAPTWQNWAARAGIDQGVFPAAWLAPPPVQDQVAAVNVEAILAGVGGDVSLVGPVWFIGHVPVDGEWDTVPMPGSGNTLTPRQYQTRWMAIFARHNPTSAPPPTTIGVALPAGTTTSSPASNVSDPTTPTPATSTSTSATGVGCGVVRDGWALPLDGLDPALFLRPHHDYPAIDVATATASSVHAIHGGTISRAGGWPGRCYPDVAGCPDICGIGITITDATNPAIEWTYCHLTAIRISVGTIVAAGEVVGLSGNTGHSSGPHLHFGVRLSGTSACPQPLLYALATGEALIPDPATLPTSGCINGPLP